jgi:hypothetical protein
MDRRCGGRERDGYGEGLADVVEVLEPDGPEETPNQPQRAQRFRRSCRRTLERLRDG